MTSTPSSNKPSKYVLAAVCLFLGWLGVHRFMTGKVKTGTYMLLMPILISVLVASPQAFLLTLQVMFIDDSIWRNEPWVRERIFKTVGMFFFGIFISLIWAFIDLIIVISGNFKDKHGNKIRH